MATSAGALREMNFMFHLFGRYGRVGRCGVPLVLGLDHPGHHHIQTNPTCLYAQSSGPTPLPLVPAPGPVSLASVWVPPFPFAQTHAHCGATRQQSPRGPRAYLTVGLQDVDAGGLSTHRRARIWINGGRNQQKSFSYG